MAADWNGQVAGRLGPALHLWTPLTCKSGLAFAWGTANPSRKALVPPHGRQRRLPHGHQCRLPLHPRRRGTRRRCTDRRKRDRRLRCIADLVSHRSRGPSRLDHAIDALGQVRIFPLRLVFGQAIHTGGFPQALTFRLDLADVRHDRVQENRCRPTSTTSSSTARTAIAAPAASPTSVGSPPRRAVTAPVAATPRMIRVAQFHLRQPRGEGGVIAYVPGSVEIGLPDVFFRLCRWHRGIPFPRPLRGP